MADFKRKHLVTKPVVTKGEYTVYRVINTRPNKLLLYIGEEITQMLVIDKEYTAIKIIDSQDSVKPILMLNFGDVLYHLYKWDEIKPVKIIDTESVISNTVPDYIKSCGIFRPEKIISFLDNAGNTYNLQLIHNIAGYETTTDTLL